MAATAGKKPKAGEEDQELNIDLLMEDIKKDILEVYAVTGGLKDGPATEGKQTIEILKVSSLSHPHYFYRTLKFQLKII